MESKIVKVSDSIRHVGDFKRKRPHQVSINRNGDSSLLISIPKSIFEKKRKLNVCGHTENCEKVLGKSTVLYYLNFFKSGQPGRVMYYQDGDWISFSMSLLELIKEHFMEKNPIFELELNGNAYLLDFVHMIKFEVKSGLQQSIAWIDEAGNCFFPEMVVNKVNADLDVDEDIRCCHYKHGKHEETAFENQSTTNEINLQLDIDINLLSSPNFSECTGESDDLVVQDEVNEVPCEGVNVNPADIKNKQVCPESKYLDLDNVRNLFLKGMRSCDGIVIIDVHRSSSSILQSREELFLKQVEITAKHRGNANVHYAWLTCTKDASSNILKYGIGSVALSSSCYGIGVHLSSVEHAYLSANLSDVDENGVQYVVLCQVALGNMEVVNHGSDQFHPSSEEYDTGVDDLNSPTYHVIWNMDVSSRVYPECIISFKTSSNSKGCNVDQKVCDTSGVTASHRDRHKVLLGSAFKNMATKPLGVNNVPARTLMARKPTWMPFPILFASISHQVSDTDMNLIMTEYDLFKKEKKSRDDFVKKLRLIVGDQLLMSTIKQLQCHQVSPPPNAVSKPEHGCPNAST